MMYSVTDRIKQVKRPGRFIKVSDFTKIQYDDGKTLNPSENIDGSVMGRVVDYMTRAVVSGDTDSAFHYSLEGAKYADAIATRNCVKATDFKMASGWLKHIRGLDDDALIHAVKLSCYDLWYRNPVSAMLYGADMFKTPDSPTIHNIRVMVLRSMKFLKDSGGEVKFDFTFEPDGYTETVSSGDGDFLTADTLWDMKVLRSRPKTINALQVLVYWVMGKHSGQKIYNGITKVGLFNPRLNEVYVLDVSKVSPEVIKGVESEILCY